MNIFSEIYGTYFRIVSKAVKTETVTRSQINDIIQEEGFRDSVLFLPQKLIPKKDGSDWGLLKENKDGTFSRVTKNTPVNIMTRVQKMWLKSKLFDPKIGLFLEDGEMKSLEKKLEDVDKMYKSENYRYIDKFSDGDNYSDADYRNNFKTIVTAIKNREILRISFNSGHKKRVTGCYLPVKIQYSEKNDKFRLYCYGIVKGKLMKSTIINLGRIETVTNTGEFYKDDISVEKLFSDRRCKEPVLLRVTPERNGVERFMNEFAAYEKHSECDLETGVCEVKLWYDRFDETEILIRLLSFGPVLEILGPADFREKAVERVKKQVQLFSRKEDENNG